VTHYRESSATETDVYQREIDEPAPGLKEAAVTKEAREGGLPSELAATRTSASTRTSSASSSSSSSAHSRNRSEAGYRSLQLLAGVKSPVAGVADAEGGAADDAAGQRPQAETSCNKEVAADAAGQQEPSWRDSMKVPESATSRYSVNLLY